MPSPMLAGLLKKAAADPRLTGLIRHLGDDSLHVTGIDQVRPWALGAMAVQSRSPLLVVTATGREAEDLAAELRAMLGGAVAFFPSWETLPHERLSPGVDIIGRQAEILDHLHDYSVVVAPARAVCQPLVEKVEGRPGLLIEEGKEYEFSALTEALVFRAYEHVDMVAKRGQFAVRGGILDVFPTTFDYPVRIEFWGDEITDMRQFSVEDQRTLTELTTTKVELYPARALPITPQVAERAAELALRHPGNAALVELLTKVSESTPADGMEALIPALTDSPMRPLPEFFPEGTHVVVLGPERVRRRILDLENTDREFLEAGWEAAAMGATGPLAAEGLDLGASSYRSYDSLEAGARKAGQPWWTFSPPGMFEVAEAETLPLEFSTMDAPRGNPQEIARFTATLREELHGGATAVYLTPTAGAIKRMVKNFTEAGIPTSIALAGATPKAGEVTFYQALSHAGLIFADFSVITETDLTGNRVSDLAGAKRRPARRRNRVDPLALTKGDYVVHETHGIGRFLKMAERTITTGEDASRREYIVLEYAPSKRGQPADQLWVPMDSLDLLSRYTGGEAPTLSKMGGSDWKNTKKKARAKVREIANELVELYAKRQGAPGHAFAADSPWQLEMEEAFPYVETEDQLAAVDAIKEDMEKPVPMDRVIIGDVGYGKTEVAVRAAFKAVADGRQVAVLVPTTLLAQQHYQTFSERMDAFGVNIRVLSRFTSAKESKEILAGLADGSVEIVIGTHRLLQTGVQWKKLGLIIIDEEQRFGVEHKEHIKALRTNVDVLTMSATPIPRTLEMSMTGIREISQILTPPEDRHPVLTYVGPEEPQQIAASIRRELLRDGQVFFIHNRVKDIEAKARELRDLVPEARIVVAHGQMNEEQLERTVQGFWDREYDVLVCTTIVETGLDISNANTLIVENAHHMGLSQLHQLRGRVGRSRERGYAYFLYPKGATLTETSYERLATIAQNNDLGAGMAVAMKDLEMRGAGNVLGAQQSGHIEGVGFDLYMRLVGEAVETFRALARGEVLDATDHSPKEIRIDLPVDAHIPERYINSERLRLEVYRKIAASEDNADLLKIREEIQDRYGAVPHEVHRLFCVARLRHQARKAGVTEIVMQGARAKFHPAELSDSQQVRLKRLYPGSAYRAAAKAMQIPLPKAGPRVTDPTLRDEDLVQWAADTLADLFGLERIDVRTGATPAPQHDESPQGAAGSRKDSAARTARGSAPGTPRAGTRRATTTSGGADTRSAAERAEDRAEARAARRQAARARSRQARAAARGE